VPDVVAVFFCSYYSACMESELKTGAQGAPAHFLTLFMLKLSRHMPAVRCPLCPASASTA
jgi:hypothetical protein